MISGKLLGVAALKKQIDKLNKSFEENRNLAVQESTLALHKSAIEIVSENANGVQSVRYNPRRTVTVSKAGDPPHTDTGRLRQSIKFDYKKGIGRVGSNLKYAAWLEFGTENMSPRPWLSVAISRVSKEVDKIFSKWMNKAIKEGTQ